MKTFVVLFLFLFLGYFSFGQSTAPAKISATIVVPEVIQADSPSASNNFIVSGEENSTYTIKIPDSLIIIKNDSEIFTLYPFLDKKVGKHEKNPSKISLGAKTNGKIPGENYPCFISVNIIFD